MKIAVRKMLVSQNADEKSVGISWARENFDLLLEMTSEEGERLVCFIYRTPKEEFSPVANEMLLGWHGEIFIDGIESSEVWKYPNDGTSKNKDDFVFGKTEACFISNFIMKNENSLLSWLESRDAADAASETIVDSGGVDDIQWKSLFARGQDFSWKKYLSASSMSLMESMMLMKKQLPNGAFARTKSRGV